MTYRFGEYTLDMDTRRLLEQEQELHLSPKAFDLLHLLVENHARAMSKAELHEKLWPSTFVQEANLASLVAEIRRALHDPADQPRYVRTVPRFGYWFVGRRRESAPADDSHPTARCWLVWAARQVALNEGENILGRAPDAVVWIDAAGVSRQHARIKIHGVDATIEDLGSKNGTYLHGERLTGPGRLADGDEIRLGSVVLKFRIPSHAGASTETASF